VDRVTDSAPLLLRLPLFFERGLGWTDEHGCPTAFTSLWGGRTQSGRVGLLYLTILPTRFSSPALKGRLSRRESEFFFSPRTRPT
jgi:hypothetical protein